MKKKIQPKPTRGRKTPRSVPIGKIATKRKNPASPARLPKPSGGPVRKVAARPGRQPAVPTEKFPIVGIGASAGGLEAFTQLLKHLPEDTGMGFVLVQHLDPAHESALTTLLARATKMPVTEVTQRLTVRPNHVYVIPPNVNLTIRGGVLQLQPRPGGRAPHNSIDTFLNSLAEDRQDRAIGVILSGTATDGTFGLEAIKAEGGITIAQDESAKFDSMPRNAIAAGCVDLVLAPAAIANELVRIAHYPRPMAGLRVAAAATKRGRRRPAVAEKSADGMREILRRLRVHTGVDFSLYKPSTIERRINRRMVLNRHHTQGDYAAFLKSNPKEIDALYADVLISVTGFFRNPEAFDVLKRKVFSALLADRGRDEPVRVWTLGCSTGQEAYSIAMAYAEFTAKLSRPPQLQVFATDLNEALLNKARRGHYAKALVQDLSPQRLRRFFVEEEGGYRINKALRESVIFARQNALSDPPFSRMDLISCRNLLIYLEGSLQRKIMPAFHYALKPGGFLFLGASESISGYAELFGPADAKQKIFIKKTAPTPSFRLPLPAVRTDVISSRTPLANDGPRVTGLPEGLRGEIDAQREADRLSVNQFAPPGVLINAELQVLQFRGATGAYLEPPPGRATFNLLKMARTGLMHPLRTAIAEAKRKHQPVRRESVRVPRDGASVMINLQVIPLTNLKETCYLILFEEPVSTRAHVAESAAEPAHRTGKAGDGSAKRRIGQLERDLAESRDYLQAIQEQHEASSEELHASSEEVQSANEELQSINEELETSKEELESTNEELVTVNEEMLHRNAELDRVNSDLKNLQESTHTAILLVGRDLSIRRFTPLAEKAFNLHSSDVGRSLIHLKHNLLLPDLEEVVALGIANANLPEREVQDRDGRWYLLRVRPYVTLDHQIDGAVVALIDIDALKRHEQAIMVARDYAQAIIRTAREPFLILQGDLKVKSASEAFYTNFRTSVAQTEGRFLEELDHGRWNYPQLRQQLLEVFSHQRPVVDFELKTVFSWSGPRVLLLNARLLETSETSETSELMVLDIEDVTERRESRAALRRSEIRYRRLFEAAKDGIMILDPVTRKITDANPYMVQLLGYNRAELTGKELWEIGLLKDEAASQEAFRELQENGFIRYEDLPLLTKQGDRREVEFVSNLYEEDGHQVVQCNIRDITVRKQTEAALYTAMDKLQLAQDAAERGSRAKDDFLAALSHELRTPLTPVLLTAAALTEDKRLPADVREQLTMMERNITLEARLIDDLLDLTKIAHGKLQFQPELCDVHELIGLALEIVEEDARAKAITIERRFSAAHSGVMVDPTRFQQVIWNLLSNAVKFTPAEGRIAIHTREQAHANGQTWLQIEIADSGIGIEPTQLELIFRSFDQGSLPSGHRFGGVGLGLAIARAVVEQHGGRINALSAGPHSGATFVIELPGAVVFPAKSGDPVAPPVSRAKKKIPVKGKVVGLRLLLVEDHPSTLQVLTRLLVREGHHVVPVSTVATALAAAKVGSFDLVISDLALPDGTGIELMAKLRDRHGLRGVALTGYGMEGDVARTREAGFITHLIKPVAIDELRQVLAKITPTAR